MSKLKYIVPILLLTTVIAFLYFVDAYNKFLNSGTEKNISLQIDLGTSKSKVLTEIKKNLGLNELEITFSKVYLYLNKNISFDTGNYSFEKGVTYTYMFNNIRNGTVQKKVTFLEGWRVEENSLELKKSFDPDYARNYYLEARAHIGYLFPDTYFTDINTSPQDLINIQLKEFEDKTKKLFENYNGTLSKKERITLASIVEREVSSQEDRKTVAGILIKRYKEGSPLDADATIQYGLGTSNSSLEYFPNCLQTECKVDFWPINIKEEDLKSEDPYNTRGKVGLPPTPICNPSLNSIEAVINPEESQYYYYLTGTDGITRYAETLDQHIANISKYL